jgi:O-antigen ligase
MIGIVLAAFLFASALACAATGSNNWLWAGAALAIGGYWVTCPSFMLLLPLVIAIQLLPWPVPSVAPLLTAFELARVIVYLAMFVTLREIAKDHANSEWLLLIIPLVFGCIEAAMGILQHSGPGKLALGTFANHSHFAGFMAMLLPVAIVFAISQRQILAYSVPLVIFAALLYSFSRMGFAASMVSILAMVLIRTKKARFTAAATAIVILGSLIMAPNGWGARFQRLATFEGLSHDAEFGLWRDTLGLIAARPVFGSGAGTYEIAFAPYNSNPKPWPVYHADNDYLELLAELGIAGTVTAVALFGIALFRCYRASQTNLAALGCMAAIIALLIHSIFEFQMHIPANVLAVCWIAGVGCGIARRTAPQAQQSRDQRKRSFTPELVFHSGKVI